MATYEIKRQPDGQWRIWARYTPFKGAATKSRVVTVVREDIGKAITESQAFVDNLRWTE